MSLHPEQKTSDQFLAPHAACPAHHKTAAWRSWKHSCRADAPAPRPCAWSPAMTARNSTMTAAWAATAASRSSSGEEIAASGRSTVTPACPSAAGRRATPRQRRARRSARCSGAPTDRAGGSTLCRVAPLASWSSHDLDSGTRSRQRWASAARSARGQTLLLATNALRARTRGR
jgi:hypothetical protein